MFATEPPTTHRRKDFLKALLDFLQLRIGLPKEETAGTRPIAPRMFEPVTTETVCLAPAPSLFRPLQTEHLRLDS